MILKKKKTTAAAPSGEITAGQYDVLVKPVITEKSTIAAEHNKVTFQVASEANKQQIKSAVESLFKVNVLSVNTLNRKGKTKSFRGTKGRQQDKKQAIVTLKEGQTIDIAAGVK